MHGYSDRMNRWPWFAGGRSRLSVSLNWAAKALVAFVLLVGIVALIEHAGPAILILGILAGLFLFARAWVREFYYLMRLADEVFPGQNDKLIWAILLIVAPPVGLLLFRSYRRAHWADTKPESAADDLD
jgi:hypothetical protein